MQSVSSRIWTRVAVSNSYDDNDYTTTVEKGDGGFGIKWPAKVDYAIKPN